MLLLMRQVQEIYYNFIFLPKDLCSSYPTHENTTMKFNMNFATWIRQNCHANKSQYLHILSANRTANC